MSHTQSVTYNAVFEQPDNVEAWIKIPNLVDLDKRGLPNWKWRDVAELHQSLKKHSHETPAYSTFRPNRISPGTKPDFVWLEINGTTVTTHIGDIDECPIFSAIWGQKKVLVPLGWARGVSHFFREVNIRELRRDGRVKLIDGSIGTYQFRNVPLQVAA